MLKFSDVLISKCGTALATTTGKIWMTYIQQVLPKFHKLIKEKYSKTLFPHCATHWKNLVVNDVNDLAEVRNTAVLWKIEQSIPDNDHFRGMRYRKYNFSVKHTGPQNISAS
jgi:hypothetical protein